MRWFSWLSAPFRWVIQWIWKPTAPSVVNQLEVVYGPKRERIWVQPLDSVGLCLLCALPVGQGQSLFQSQCAIDVEAFWRIWGDFNAAKGISPCWEDGAPWTP